MIPSVDEAADIPSGSRCQEASMFSRGTYIPCNAPVVAMVRHDRDRRSYLMCLPCACHNIRNRGGKLVKAITSEIELQIKEYASG